MKVVFSRASDFKEIISLVSRSLDEIPFVINDEGLSVKALSEDKTTMVILKVPSEYLEALELEVPVKFTVRASEFSKVLKRAARGDSLGLSVEGDELVVTFQNEKQRIKRNFKIPIASRDVEEIGEPKVELPVELSMASRDFKEVVEDAKRVGGEVKLLFENKELRVSAESTGRGYLAVLREDAPLISLRTSTEKAESKYSIDLLYSVARGLPSDGVLVLSFGEQLPLKLSSELEKIGTIAYWVAPTA